MSLARIRHKLPKCVRRLLVESLVFPHIRYCLTVWGGCTTTQRPRVQKAINFGGRIVTGLSRRDHVTPSLRELGWPSICELITERDIATVRHLTTSADAPELLRCRVVRRSDVSLRRTRASDGGQLELPRARTELARRSFLHRAARAWNTAALDVTPSFSLGSQCLCWHWVFRLGRFRILQLSFITAFYRFLCHRIIFIIM